MLDLESALQTAKKAAHAAGERIMKDFKKEVSSTQKTDPADRVTQVDVDAQNIIHTIIADAYPDHSFLEEEGDALPDNKDAVWIIDPLDGTSNFIQGIEHMGVSIALQSKDEIVLGLLHFPALNCTYTAIKGQGAFCNGERIAVSRCNALADAYASEIFSDRTHRGTSALYPPVRAYRRFGSAITSLAFIAEGKLHATALRCYLWDVAAASLLITEAGGNIRYKRDDPEDMRSPLYCIAAVPGIFEEFADFVEREYYHVEV